MEKKNGELQKLYRNKKLNELDKQGKYITWNNHPVQLTVNRLHKEQYSALITLNSKLRLLVIKNSLIRK